MVAGLGLAALAVPAQAPAVPPPPIVVTEPQPVPQLLTPDHERALASRLVNVADPSKPTEAELARARDRLHEMLNQPGGEVPDLELRTLALRNFVRMTTPEIMSRITRIDFVWNGGLIELRAEPGALATTLHAHGYAVNAWWDELVTDHRDISARQLTDYPDHPGLHFVNDDASEPSKFWVHVDQRSVHSRHTNYYLPYVIGNYLDKIESGATHDDAPISPREVDHFLNSRFQ